MQRAYRAGPGVEAGVLWPFNDNYRLRASVTEQWHLFQDQNPERVTQLRLDHAYSLGRNQELRQSNVLEIPYGRSSMNWFENRLEFLIFFR